MDRQQYAGVPGFSSCYQYAGCPRNLQSWWRAWRVPSHRLRTALCRQVGRGREFKVGSHQPSFHPDESRSTTRFPLQGTSIRFSIFPSWVQAVTMKAISSGMEQRAAQPPEHFDQVSHTLHFIFPRAYGPLCWRAGGPSGALAEEAGRCRKASRRIQQQPAVVVSFAAAGFSKIAESWRPGLVGRQGFRSGRRWDSGRTETRMRGGAIESGIQLARRTSGPGY